MLCNICSIFRKNFSGHSIFLLVVKEYGSGVVNVAITGKCSNSGDMLYYKNFRKYFLIWKIST